MLEDGSVVIVVLERDTTSSNFDLVIGLGSRCSLIVARGPLLQWGYRNVEG